VVRPEDVAEKPHFESKHFHSLYWRAWECLRFDRHYGAMGGEGPIPYMVISQYARDNGISGNDFRIFHILLSGIDAEWLKYAAEKQKREAAKNG
jgi:hypothetical protein